MSAAALLRLAGARPYTMPDGAEDVSVLRVVVGEGFSADLARSLWRT